MKVLATRNVDIEHEQLKIELKKNNFIRNL